METEEDTVSEGDRLKNKDNGEVEHSKCDETVADFFCVPWRFRDSIS